MLYSHQGLSFGGVISSSKIRTSQMLEIFDLLVSYCKESSILKILYKPIPSIYHNQPSDEDLYALFRNKAQCFRGDISTAINLRDKIKYNSLRKRNIKKAIKSGVQVREGQDSDSLHDIIELRRGIFDVANDCQHIVRSFAGA